MKKAPSLKIRRVTISEQKEDEEKMEEKMEGKRKRMQSSVAEKPKTKRIIVHSITSEGDEDASSSEMDTDSGSEEVFEPNGPDLEYEDPGTREQS